MKIIRIRGWGDLQHYKTRAAPWVKLYRHDLTAERPEGASYLPLSLAARGLLADLQRLAVETGNATPYYPDWLAVRLRIAEPLAPLLAELLANGRLEMAENAITPASTFASGDASAVSTLGSAVQADTPALSRLEGLREGERAVRRSGRNSPHPRGASKPEPLADVLRHAAARGFE